ncbi:MAG TPA: DUF2007 domain-containing protein [Flavobacterium sp.]
MIQIFTGNYSEAMIIKNILENDRINVFTINESMSIIEPVAISSGGYNAVSLQVREEDVAKAAEIIDDYNSGKLDLGQ